MKIGDLVTQICFAEKESDIGVIIDEDWSVVYFNAYDTQGEKRKVYKVKWSKNIYWDGYYEWKPAINLEVIG